MQVPANADHASHVIAASIAREEPFRTELQGHVRIFGTMSPEWYAETLFKLGAKSTHVRLQVYGHALADTGSVVEWVRGSLLTDYQSRLSPDSFEAFLDRYHDRLIDTLGAHAPYYYAFKRILFAHGSDHDDRLATALRHTSAMGHADYRRPSHPDVR